MRALLGNLALERGDPVLAHAYFDGAAALLAASADPDNPAEQAHPALQPLAR